MPQVPDRIAFCLPADADPAAVLDALGRHADLVSGPASSSDRVYLDTFDGRLHAAGLELWRDARRPRDGTFRLTLEEPGQPTRTAPVASGRPDRLLAVDLPEGSFRDRLQPVIEERALLPLVRVRSRQQPVAVRNRDGKTITRVLLEEPRVILSGHARPSLGRRLHVAPVLGYERSFASVSNVLGSKVGLPRATASLVDEAVAAAGQTAGGVSAKVDVGLEPGMRADEASVLICRRLADIVEANLPGTLADVDTEFLHDLRVAVRRTRSVLKEMKHVLPAGGADRARADLRWIQEITGPTRDLDVQLHQWPDLVGVVSPSMAEDLPPLHDLLIRHRASAFDTMRRRLKGTRYRDAWATWRTLLDSPLPSGDGAAANAAVPVGDLAGHRIVAVYRTMVKMGSAIGDDSPPLQLHDLRKRGKELRYLLELFGGLWPTDTVKPLVSTLKALQDVLGRFQDDEIQTAYLRGLGPELAAAPGGTDSLIALGLVIDRLAEDQRSARAAFAERFAPFAGTKTHKLVSSTFTSGQGRARRRGDG